MKNFLIKVLGFKPHKISDENVNRLFKLLDYHNRKNVQFIDFEEALNKHFGKKDKPKQNSSSDASRTKGSLYWIRIAKDRLGDYISRNYKNASEAFKGKLINFLSKM